MRLLTVLIMDIISYGGNFTRPAFPLISGNRSLTIFIPVYCTEPYYLTQVRNTGNYSLQLPVIALLKLLQASESEQLNTYAQTKL